MADYTYCFVPLLTQIFNDLSGNYQSGNRRDKSIASRNIPAVCTVPFRSRRTNAVGSAADRHIFYGLPGGFLGIDDFQMIDSPFPKLSPHNPRQRINPGLRDIRHTKRRWVQFVSRTHAADDRCTSLSTFFRQCQLCRNRIHGIHHIVIIFKRKGIGILRQKKAGVYPHIS